MDGSADRDRRGTRRLPVDVTVKRQGTWSFTNSTQTHEDRVHVAATPGWRSLSSTAQSDYFTRILESSGVNVADFCPAIMDTNLLTAVSVPHPSLQDEYEPGSTEPYVAELLCALLKASGRTRVVELGAFKGTTSAWICSTLAKMGGGRFTAVEFDPEAPERADWTQSRLEALQLPETVVWDVLRSDALAAIASFPDASIGFAFVDDDHTKRHVHGEIEALWPKMQTGGFIVGHDVWGSCDLQTVFAHFGGYSLDLPRLGAAGGLGLIQVR